ncbi:MAG: GNAT family N-acetyltransferase [Luteolibacter sp.]|uniref:GNAT family N-acetyltransferase n=1 Tax=Luteolibacter sp. TaxID=1962973 RepID=UPI00326592E0
MHAIRRLNPGEASLYRAIRLEALKESPEAFGSTYQSALERDDASWVAQADASARGEDRATFVVLTDRPVGLAALYRIPEHPDQGELLQMWIAPDLRGGSAAADLLDSVFQWASTRSFRIIRAEVTAGNGRAFRFYEKYGFRPVDPAGGGTILTKEVGQAAPSGGDEPSK